MESRISLITLGVADLGRARGFYQKLGLKASASSDGSVVFFQMGPMVLALYPHTALAEDAGVDAGAGSPGFRGVTLAHNVRTRDAVATTLAEAVAAGGTLVKPATDAVWGGHTGYFADPDGHLWEVAWNPKAKLGPDGSFSF